MRMLKTLALGGASALALASAAHAEKFDIPRGDLAIALDAYTAQTGIQLLYSSNAVSGHTTRGVKGELAANAALQRILVGTGYTAEQMPQGAISIVREKSQAQHEGSAADRADVRLASVDRAASSVETVIVTSSKIKGDIQTVPIAITALSQEQLTERQIAGGPDLVKEVPNLTFSKTNFTGYNIEIRGIGTQAISVTTDPAVAVAFNDTPFIRNHFFEQEFFDVSQVEVLRGPQGTLYGRNATAGVVNVVSAKPTDEFEAMLSADWGNYSNRRYEGMVNLPIVSDKLMLRIAGEWTKRDGYSFNAISNSPIDGRDLWSVRSTLRWQPVQSFRTDFIWEHFQEDDDRLRTAKQLCKRDNGPSEIMGTSTAAGPGGLVGEAYLSQGCLPTNMYGSDAFQVPNGYSLPYYGGLVGAGSFGAIYNPLIKMDPYASTTQSQNLRVIESTLNPRYRAKNDTIELNSEYDLTPALTLTSDTGYNRDFLWSTEDFNRFNTQPGIFGYYPADFGSLIGPLDPHLGICQATYGECTTMGVPCDPAHESGLECPRYGTFTDPQLGKSDRLVGQDLSDENAWQVSQELRLASNFDGPFNFSFGGNYLHYVTEENYYVFFNTLTMFAANSGGLADHPWIPGVSDNSWCLRGHQFANPNVPSGVLNCLGYIDPNPLTSLNNQGHNYFLSQNPYFLNSYALFGEMYYNITHDLKLTAGLRWTDDQKHFVEIPSELLTIGYGYPSTGTINQQWKEWTGRAVADWTPQLSFTDQSMFYASYAHGYKAGGANPPGAVLLVYGNTDISNPVHPKTFAPEFNDAFEIGTKNTGLDGDLTLNADVFYYNYKGYQISQIVDRTSVNLNFNATVRGAEMQATWSPLPGLKLGFAGGYENTSLANGSKAIDLLDRTAGNPNWVVVKPYVTQASNCVLPAYVVQYLLIVQGFQIPDACGNAYNSHMDPLTYEPYMAYPGTSSNGTPIPDYPGFDPLAGSANNPYTGQNVYNGIDYGPAPNNGAGFYKNLSGKELPNAPHYTVSLTTDYTMPVSANWAATLHGDFYWQSQSWARVFNAVGDKIHGYSNVNLALILTDASGWQVMGYVKNIFDTTAITGTFLNSDDTGLTTNVFLTDPRLFGVRVTKHFDGGSDNNFDLFGTSSGRKPQIWLTLGGGFSQLQDDWQKFDPDFASAVPSGLPNPQSVEGVPHSALDWEGKLSFEPNDSGWIMKAGIRYGSSSQSKNLNKNLPFATADKIILPTGFAHAFSIPTVATCETVARVFAEFNNVVACPFTAKQNAFVVAQANSSEKHAILDFTIGKEFGIGSGKSEIGGGVRVAQFHAQAYADLNSEPFYNFPKTLNPFAGGYSAKYGVLYDGTTQEKRNFRGIGPEITWDAQQPLWGNQENGQVTFDWGVNAAMLFGRQTAQIKRTLYEHKCHPGGGGTCGVVLYSTPTTINRSRRVTVPNLGGYVGASVRYQNAKISLGYRADEFFNAMDGGQDTAKKYDRGFYGPYLNLSIGFGG